MDTNQDTVRSTRELLFDSDHDPDWEGEQEVPLSPTDAGTSPCADHNGSVTPAPPTVRAEGTDGLAESVRKPLVPEGSQEYGSPSKPTERGDHSTPSPPPRTSRLSVHWEPRTEGGGEREGRDQGGGDDLEVTKGRVTFSRKKDIIFMTAQTSVEEDPGPISPRSITSHTSVGSSDKPPKKDLELEMKLCIGLLFVFMVTGVTLVFHFYNIRQLEVEMGRRLVYEKTQRDIVLHNHERRVVLEGVLGLNLHPEKLPAYCDGKDHNDKTEEFCLTWKDLATLSISSFEVQDDVSCYNISWISLSPDLLLQDCFRLGTDSWYGLGLAHEQRWPLDMMRTNRTPFVVGSGRSAETLGTVLEPYFLSSAGVTLMVDSADQLEVSLNAELPGLNSSDVVGDNLLCLFSSRQHMHDHNTSPHINYTVCVARDVRQAHNVSRLSTPTPPPLQDAILLYPVWSTLPALTANFFQAAVDDFVQEIVAASYRRSLLVINGPWESRPGDHTFDPHLFPDPHTLVENAQSHGFDMVLAAHPYISYDSENFVAGVREGFLVRDVTGGVAGLTRWWLPAVDDPGLGDVSGIGAVVDVTGPGRGWLQAEINNVSDTYNIDGVYWVGGQIDMQPYNPTLAGDVASFNEYISRLAELQAPGENCHNVRQSAYKSQHIPGLVRVSGRTSTWDGNGLASVIPTTLTLGMLGYHNILTDVIGGNAYENFPSKELYIRWMQLSTFLPTMHFSIPPDHYDNYTRILARSLIQTRAQVVVPEIRWAMAEGVPAVRPLWSEWPGDAEALAVNDQILVGRRLLVAPVVESGARRRDVYLPRGAWQRAGTHSVVSGPGWLRDQSVPLSRVLYFVLVE